MPVDLYTASKPRRQDVTGSPEQTFGSNDPIQSMLNMIMAFTLAAIGMPNVNGKMIWIFFPCIHKDLEGRPVSIVGNVSNKKGTFALVEIPLSEINFFSIIGREAVIPRVGWGRGPNLIPEPRLKDTPWEGKTDVGAALVQGFLPIYFGQEVPDVNIFDEEAEAAFAHLGPGPAAWHKYVKEARGPNANDILSLTDSISTAQEDAQYLQTGDRVISNRGPIYSINHVDADIYPEIAEKVRGSCYFLFWMICLVHSTNSSFD